jgi:transposase
MDVVHSRCAGLDVHQATVVATVRVPAERGGRQVVTETFGTMTADLLTLRDWLQAFGVTHVALESTGSIGSRSIRCWKMRSPCF